MAWRRDPATGEWEMVDNQTPDPMTQGTTGQESDPSSRDVPPSAIYDQSPTPPQAPPYRTAEGGYTHPDLAFPPAAQPTYQNEDANPLESNSALRRWLEDEVWAKGLSADLGTGEVIDPDTGKVVGHVPSFPRMN